MLSFQQESKLEGKANPQIELEIISQQPSGTAKATPLLFVHGAWHGAWCWEPHFLPYFAQQGYEVHALSLRGHGNSAGRDRLRWHSAAQYVEDVAQVAALLKSPPVVIGHSMGGYVVQKYLEQYDAPAGVLMASIPTRGALPFFIRFFFRHPLAFLKTNLTLTPYHFVSTPELVKEGFFSDNFPLEKVHEYCQNVQSESFRIVIDAGIRKLPKPKRVKTPMLVLAAERDRVFTIAEARRTAQAYDTEAEIFPDTAHDMLLNTQWQPVADRILAWLGERGL